MPSGLTLIESAKYMSDPATVGVIQILAGGNPVLEVLPFIDVEGLTYPYNTEAALPTIAFRGLNETYTASVGLINPENETLKPMGGVNDTDRVFIKTVNGYRSRQDAMFIKSSGRKYAASFFEGDSGANKKDFDGLKTRLTGGQLISAGATANGVDLNSTAGVEKLDEAIDAVAGSEMDTYIFMSKLQRRKLTQFSRSNTNHQLEWEMSDAGRRIARWAGFEIRVTDADDDASQTALLSIIEPDSGAANNTTTSIYIVRFDPDGQYCAGLQHVDGLEVQDKGSVNNATTETTLVEWLAGMLVAHTKSAARLRHLKTT